MGDVTTTIRNFFKCRSRVGVDDALHSGFGERLPYYRGAPRGRRCHFSPFEDNAAALAAFNPGAGSWRNRHLGMRLLGLLELVNVRVPVAGGKGTAVAKMLSHWGSLSVATAEKVSPTVALVVALLAGPSWRWNGSSGW